MVKIFFAQNKHFSNNVTYFRPYTFLSLIPHRCYHSQLLGWIIQQTNQRLKTIFALSSNRYNLNKFQKHHLNMLQVKTSILSQLVFQRFYFFLLELDHFFIYNHFFTISFGVIFIKIYLRNHCASGLLTFKIE